MIPETAKDVARFAKRNGLHPVYGWIFRNGEVRVTSSACQHHSLLQKGETELHSGLVKITGGITSFNFETRVGGPTILLTRQQEKVLILLSEVEGFKYQRFDNTRMCPDMLLSRNDQKKGRL